MHQRYVYRPSKGSAMTVLIVGLVVVLGSLVMMSLGAQVGKFGNFLSTEASRVAWLFFMVGGVALTAAGALMTRLAYSPGGEVVVTPTMISAPKSELSSAIVQIDPATISDFKVYKQNGNEVSTLIISATGKVKLLRNHFQPTDGYQHCMSAIREVAARAHQHPMAPH